MNNMGIKKIDDSVNVYITDKTGKKRYNTTCGRMFAMSEVRNLRLKLEQAKKYPSHFHFLDVDSARVVIPENIGDAGIPCIPVTGIETTMTNDELLSELEEL